MTVTQKQIDIAKANGLTNVEALAAAADKYKVPFALAAAVLDKETDGKNIYGHDRGGKFTLKNGDKEVTEENWNEFKRDVLPNWPSTEGGMTSNGVGPMQLTWKGFFPDMVSKGFKPWVPADNIMYGVSLISQYWNNTKNIRKVGTAYNGGAAYGVDLTLKEKKWRNLVGTDDVHVTTPMPPAEPLVDYMGRTIYHSSQWKVDYVKWKGSWVTVVDAKILDCIQEEVRSWWGELNLTQGGLSHSVKKSASTHDGIGCFDVQTKGNKPDSKSRTKGDVFKLASVFLRSGMVFWARGYSWDLHVFDKHGHVVSRESYYSCHEQAQRQYDEFDRFRKKKSQDGDGLVGTRPYFGPKTAFERWTTSPYNKANVLDDNTLYYVNVETTLYGNDVDRVAQYSRKRNFEVQAVKDVKRWDRVNVVTDEGIYYAKDYLSTVPLNGDTPQEVLV